MMVELEPTHGDEAPARESPGGNIIKRSVSSGIQMPPLSWKRVA